MLVAGFALVLAAASGAVANQLASVDATSIRGAEHIEVIPFDRTRSHAQFQVRVAWLFTVEGRFGAVDGEVRIDRDARLVSVVAEIDAAAVAMNSESNATWARSDEFFDTARYPKIHFESEPFPLAALDSGGIIIGRLTVRGKVRPTSFTLRPSGCPGLPARTCPVIADGSIQRGDFGMRSRRATLADKVKLHFTVFVGPR